MDSYIHSLVTKVALQALKPASTTPYAVMHTDMPSDEGDSLCLLLPGNTQPDHNELVADQLIMATAGADSISWKGPDSQTLTIGSASEPVSDEVRKALESDSGLLVLFIDVHSAAPQAWAVMQVAQVN